MRIMAAKISTTWIRAISRWRASSRSISALRASTAPVIACARLPCGPKKVENSYSVAAHAPLPGFRQNDGLATMTIVIRISIALSKRKTMNRSFTRRAT